MGSEATDSASTAKRIKAIKNARVCVDCGQAINDVGLVNCPSCGSLDISDRHSSPCFIEKPTGIHLAFPFDGITMLPGTTMLLSGYQGSGKTTSCLKMLRDAQHRILTSEQQAQAVARTWYRLHGEGAPRPRISHCYSWDDLLLDIEGIEKGEIIVVDSVSQLATGHQVAGIVKAVIEVVRQAGAYAFFITQFNKEGSPLGPNELGHLVDLTAEIPQDKKMGMRRLVIPKDRNGIAHERYFRLGAKGPEPEKFEYAYSVEGPAGNYRLHMYPLGGAIYDGILDALAGIHYNLEGKASCGVACPAYSSGYAQPSDVDQRRKFAEREGLEWITPEEANAILAEQDPTAGASRGASTRPDKSNDPLF